MTSDSFNASSRAEVEENLRTRAWKDKAFRQELVVNPKEVLEREYPQCFENGKAPDDITYKVIEEDAKTHYIVLPAIEDEVSSLTESSLEMVTGGGIGTIGKIIKEHPLGRPKRPRETEGRTNPFCDSINC